MGRLFVFIICVLLQTFVCMAQSPVEALILDDNTGKPLYGVNIVTDGGLGTITNSDGCFLFDSVQDKTLRISHIGYHSRVIALDTLSPIIRLKPQVYELSPAHLTFVNIDTDSLTSAIFDKMIVLSKNYKDSDDVYLYRQTSMCDDSLCYQFIEGFFTAKSPYGLDQLTLTKGRYAELPSDSTHCHMNMSDMYSLSRASFVKRTKPKKVNVIPFISPLPSSKYYDVDVRLLEEERGDGIYIINFNPKKHITDPILKGALYMDVKTSSILNFSAECVVPLEFSNGDATEGVLTIHVDYLQKGDVPIVNYVRSTLRFECTHVLTCNFR